jgi:flagellin-like protein
MKTLYGKKEKGVSPVIATILMVAITVVLASAVYIMVSGYMGGAPSKPVALSFNVQPTSSSDVFTVISGNITITASTPLIITITNSSGTQTITLSGPSSSTSPWVKSSPGVTVSSTTYYVYAQWTSVTGSYLAAGGSITLTVAATTPSSSTPGYPLSPGTTVTFTYHGTSFYSYTF